MSIAQGVIDTISNGNLSCFTLYGGYGQTYEGGRVLFPTGNQLSEKRNAAGRVISAEYKYTDGSTLRYTYSANTERYALRAS